MEQREAIWDRKAWKVDPVRYVREYRHAHPEKALAHRIQSSINLLKRNGYEVTKPEESEGKQS